MLTDVKFFNYSLVLSWILRKEEELKNELKNWKEELRKGRTEEEEWKEAFQEELKGRIKASIQGRLERNN